MPLVIFPEAPVWFKVKVNEALDICKTPVLLPENKNVLAPACSRLNVNVWPSFVDAPLSNVSDELQPGTHAVNVPLSGLGITEIVVDIDA